MDLLDLLPLYACMAWTGTPLPRTCDTVNVFWVVFILDEGSYHILDNMFKAVNEEMLGGNN
jgi:hypothetical protein